MINKIQKNLSKNMLLYTFLAIVWGLLLWLFFPELKILWKWILIIVFIMIYPTMVSISLGQLKKIKWWIKPLLIALFLNFLFAPLLIFALSSLFISDPQITLALMLLAIAPSSSMGLGYLALAEWNMIIWALIVAISFIASIFIYPLAWSYFAWQADLVVPIWLILKNLIYILIIPLILGIITREYIEKKHEEWTYEKIKPYLSVITLSSLYILIFIIFESKADLIVQNWKEILVIAPVVLIYFTVTILLMIFINKKIFKLEYGDHQSIVFTSVSKNIALTIAILIAVFWEKWIYMSIVPAIVALFQAPISMLYLKSTKYIKQYFNK